MKLEVGMYLRHSGLEGEYPIIQKITELKTPGRCGGKYKVYTDKCGDWFIDSDYIELDKSKYNFDITALIEIGDYVNGFPVIHKENDILKCGLLVQFKENEIKSIVTREQFESMSYKIEREEN